MQVHDLSTWEEIEGAAAKARSTRYFIYDGYCDGSGFPYAGDDVDAPAVEDLVKLLESAPSDIAGLTAPALSALAAGMLASKPASEVALLTAVST